jgi:hypothetical protein
MWVSQLRLYKRIITKKQIYMCHKMFSVSVGYARGITQLQLYKLNNGTILSWSVLILESYYFGAL